MPIYQLRCLNCKHEGEVILPLDAPLPLCERCQSEQERIISVPGMIKMGVVPLRYQRLGIKPPQSWEPGPGEA